MPRNLRWYVRFRLLRIEVLLWMRQTDFGACARHTHRLCQQLPCRVHRRVLQLQLDQGVPVSITEILREAVSQNDIYVAIRSKNGVKRVEARGGVRTLASQTQSVGNLASVSYVQIVVVVNMENYGLGEVAIAESYCKAPCRYSRICFFSLRGYLNFIRTRLRIQICTLVWVYSLLIANNLIVIGPRLSIISTLRSRGELAD